MRRRCAVVSCGLLIVSCSLTSLDDLKGGASDGGGMSGSASGGTGAGAGGSWSAGGNSGSGANSGAGGLAAGGGNTGGDASAGTGGGPQSVTLDAVSSSFTQNVGLVDLNWSHTVGAAPDRLMIVIVHAYSSENIDSVSYGGIDLTLAASSPAGGLIDPRVHLYRLINPPAGTANVSVMINMPVGAEEAIAAAASFHHVDQIAPLGAPSTAEGNSSNAPVRIDVASTTGELVFGAVSHRNNTIPLVAGLGQTELYNSQGASGYDIWGAGGTALGAATVTLSWSHASDVYWAAAGVSIRPPPF